MAIWEATAVLLHPSYMITPFQKTVRPEPASYKTDPFQKTVRSEPASHKTDPFQKTVRSEQAVQDRSANVKTL